MEKVLIIVGDAVETLDTMYPYYRLQEAGFERCEYFNLSGGIVALHRGYKL